MPDRAPWPSVLSDAALPCTLLQFTDLHLCAEPGAELIGVRTEASFSAVLAQAAASMPYAQACLFSGDLADDGSAAAYQRLTAHMATAPWPAVCIPGNHDNATMLHASLDTELARARCVIAGAWRVILLDSSVPNEVGGTLGEAECRHLQQALRESGDRPVLIVLHHPPVDCGSQWLDAQQLSDGERFWAILAQHPNVKAVVCGHIHQEMDCRQQGVRLLASPSTCVQFAPQSRHFKIDAQAPGYRWLTLQPDGTLTTGVVRLPAGSFPARTHDRDGY